MNIRHEIEYMGRSEAGVAGQGSFPIIFTLLCAYTIFVYVRPQEFIPGIGALRLAGILKVLLSFWALTQLRYFLRIDKLLVILFLYNAYLFFTVVYSGNTVSFHIAMSVLIYVLSVVVPIVVLLDDQSRYLKFLELWVWLNTFVALFAIAHSGRGPGDFIEDENDLALALDVAIPVAFYLSQLPSLDRLRRRLLVMCAVVMSLGVIYSFSRGGFLGLAAVWVAIWWLGRNRARNLTIAFTIALVGGGAVLKILPSGYLPEVESIADPEDSTRNERLDSWRIGWAMFLDNPVFGLGAGNYRPNSGKYQDQVLGYGGKSLAWREAHSTYVQVISDLGLVGVAMCASIIVGLWKLLGKIWLLGRAEGCDLALLARGFTISLIAYLVSGAFLSALYYPHILFLLGFAVALYRLCAEGARTERSQQHGDRRRCSAEIER